MESEQSNSRGRALPISDAVAARSLEAAQSALERVRNSMRYAEQVSPGLDLSIGWRAMDDLSLCIDAELAEAEERVSRTGR